MKKYPPPEKGKSFKASLCYYGILNGPLPSFSNDPFLKLIKNFDDVKNILQLKNSQATKYFFFAKEKVHQILLDNDEVIDLGYIKDSKELFFYFYLFLLICEDTILYNYTYDKRFITEINKLQVENQKNINKLIFAKILVFVSKDYKDITNINDEEEGINQVIKENEEIIEKMENEIWKKINISKEKFKSKNLDEIYTNIIIYLIQNEDFWKSFGCEDIFEKELDLNNIYLTPKMHENLVKYFNEKKNKDQFEKYLILSEEDLSKKEKINFYYIMFKYIFKDSYIDLDFFTETKKAIINIVKTAEEKIVAISKKSDKIEYLLILFTGSEQFKNIKEKIKGQIDKPLLQKEEPSEIGCIQHLNDIMGNDEKKIKLKEYTNRFIYKGNNEWNDLFKNLKLDVKDNEEGKLITIISKLKNIICDEDTSLNKIIKDNFYFSLPIVDLYSLENELPKKPNEEANNIFKKWMDNDV
jgi:hypothetical protein